MSTSTRVYALNGVLAGVGALILLLMLFVNVIVFIAIAIEGQSILVGLLLTATCLPFYLFGYYFIYRNYGAYQLTETQILYVKRQQIIDRMAFADVRSVQQKDWHLPPNMVLRGENKTFRINRQVDGFGELYDTLQKHIPAMQEANLSFPYILKPRRWFYTEIGIILGGFGLFFLLMTIMALTSSDTNGKALEGAATIWGLYLFIALLIIITATMELKLGVAILTWDRELVTVNYLIGRNKKWSTDQIRAIRREQYEVSYKGVRGLRQMVVIEFDDGKSLKIADADAGMFGTTVEQVRARLLTLYSNE